MLLARADWLARRGVYKSTIHLRAAEEKQKGFSFASTSEKEILSMNEKAVPKNTKMATKFGLTVFNGKLFNLSSLIF